MKMVLAYVQPFKLDEVSARLARLARFPGMSVAGVRGFGREHAELEPESIEVELDEFSDKILIQIVLHDDQVDGVVAEIARSAHTGRYGDGMVFVLPVERAVRISTLREGEQSL